MPQKAPYMGKYPHTQAGEEPGYEAMEALVIQTSI